MGAETVDSIDFSGYENANIIHDMNGPIPAQLYEKYDLVFDGGTLEHVFNFPQAIKNAMQMVKNGGHFISVTPSNNRLGNGFYRFSPELFFRIFSQENGFEVVKIFVSIYSKNGKWLEVKYPNVVRERITLVNSYETDMIVIAKRIAVTEIFESTPQQSDYAATWKTKSEADANGVEDVGVLKNIYQKIIPANLRGKIWKLRYQLTHQMNWADTMPSILSKWITETVKKALFILYLKKLLRLKITCELLDGMRRAVRQRTREPEPTAGTIDTQFVRTGNKIKGELSQLLIQGRKRHILSQHAGAAADLAGAGRAGTGQKKPFIQAKDQLQLLLKSLQLQVQLNEFRYLECN